MVLSTIHTNNAPSTITRLVDMGIEAYLISSSVICIMAQRLVRKLCDKCKKPFKPEDDLLKSLGITKTEAKSITFYEAVGCDECFQTGFKGRIAIFEVMEINDRIRKLITENANASEIRHVAQKTSHYKILLQDGIRRIKEGFTTIEEVLSVASIEETGEE